MIFCRALCEASFSTRTVQMLSGAKLVDNLDYRDSLKKQYPTAIGGEMEGSGLHAACETSKTDWIVIKAISDWGDGSKGADSDARQKLAGDHAAKVVKGLFDLAPLYEDAEVSSPPSRKRTRQKPVVDTVTGQTRITVPDYRLMRRGDFDGIPAEFFESGARGWEALLRLYA